MTDITKDELTLLHEQAASMGIEYTEKTTKAGLKKDVAALKALLQD